MKGDKLMTERGKHKAKDSAAGDFRPSKRTTITMVGKAVLDETGKEDAPRTLLQKTAGLVIPPVTPTAPETAIRPR